MHHAGLDFKHTPIHTIMRIYEIDPYMDAIFSCVPSGEGPLLS
jgi:hypothetical protein